MTQVEPSEQMPVWGVGVALMVVEWRMVRKDEEEDGLGNGHCRSEGEEDRTD